MKENRTIALPLSPPIPGFEQFVTAYLLCGERTALIDPGPKACIPELLSNLKALNIDPDSLDYILVTHIHIDHAGGVGELVRHASRARVVVHPQGVRHLAAPEKLWQGSLRTLGGVAEKYGPIDPTPEAGLVPAADGMEIDLGNRTLKVVWTPGHAPHHISFWDPEGRELFIGEAAGVYHPDVDAVRPATPPPFDIETTLDSLAKLLSLNPRTIYYCHGGGIPAERETMERSRAQLLRWREAISSHPHRERERVFEMLLLRDEELGRLRALPAPRFEREKFFILNSIAGFLEHLKITRPDDV